MHGWDALYEQPETLTMDWGHQRIYAPPAYSRMRSARTVPIVLAEAQQLAQSFPLCWAMSAKGPILAVLRHLVPTAHEVPVDARAPMPLAMHAYPFVVPDGHAIDQKRLTVDRALADKPTDIGAPLVLDTGRMSKATLQRATLALRIARALPQTEALTADLWSKGFLEPWPLRFELTPQARIEIEDLLVVSATRLADPALYRLIASHGPEAGLFLGFHRISLFRVMALLNAAKATLAPKKPDLTQMVQL